MGTVTLNPTQVFTGALASPIIGGATVAPNAGTLPVADMVQQQAFGALNYRPSSLSLFAADADAINDAMKNDSKASSPTGATVVDQNGLGLATLVGDPKNDRTLRTIGRGPVGAGAGTRTIEQFIEQVIELAIAGDASAKTELHGLLAGLDGFKVFHRAINTNGAVGARLLADFNFAGVSRKWAYDVSVDDYAKFSSMLWLTYGNYKNISALNELVELAYLSRNAFDAVLDSAKRDEVVKQRLYEMVDWSVKEMHLPGLIQLTMVGNVRAKEEIWEHVRSIRKEEIKDTIQAIYGEAEKGNGHAVRSLIERMQTAKDPYEKEQAKVAIAELAQVYACKEFQHIEIGPSKTIAAFRMIAAVDENAAKLYRQVHGEEEVGS